MAFSFRDRTIAKVGVVGSGLVGLDIALHFLRSLYSSDVHVVIVDDSEETLKKGRETLFKTMEKAVETGACKPAQEEGMKARVIFTSDFKELKGAELIVETSAEELSQKCRIFTRLEEVVSPQAILVSSSSYFEPERLFAELSYKDRALCAHYCSPIDRNPALEIIPGRDTSPAVTDFMVRLSETLGKYPIRVGSRYGYAVNPVFEGLFLACIQCVDAGLDMKQVDATAYKCLGLRPFTVHNPAGCNSQSARELSEMNKAVNTWFRVPERLRKAVDSNTSWDVPGEKETVEVPSEKEKVIAEELLGAYFAIVCNMLDAEMITPGDCDLLLSTALGMKPAFESMNSLGLGKALNLVEAFAAKYPDMPVPKSLKDRAGSGKPWDLPDLLFEKKGDIALLTVRRPRALNALNSKVIGELASYCDAIKKDPEIKAVVVTGFGNRVFVAGADIKEMAGFTQPKEAEAFARRLQTSSALLEQLGKPVVAALNGLAFGGGCELAMCCTVRIAAKGLKVFAGQPEVNLGLIPGMGGTQRLPRIVGFEKGAEMIRTADPISSAQALEYGLISEEVAGDVLHRAFELAREIASGTTQVKYMEMGPLADAPDSLPTLDIGHHSKVIDTLAVQAMLKGGKMTLEDGLKCEADFFGQCWNTEDNRIGLTTFIEKGARAKAEFIHR